jgi:hypothetical protein
LEIVLGSNRFSFSQSLDEAAASWIPLKFDHNRLAQLRFPQQFVFKFTAETLKRQSMKFQQLRIVSSEIITRQIAEKNCKNFLAQ